MNSIKAAHDFEDAADKLDAVTAELEKELTKEFSVTKDNFVNTLINNASRSENKDQKVIPLGPFKGNSTNEAVSKVMKKNETLPTSIRSKESSEAKDKLNRYVERLAELEAEHEVRVESISSIYDHKVDNNLRTIKELMDQIKVLDDRIGELSSMNLELMKEKSNHINAEGNKHSQQVSAINQLVTSLKNFIENLAVTVN